MSQQTVFHLEALIVLQLLEEIDCCYGYSLTEDGYAKFWEAQQRARDVLLRLRCEDSSGISSSETPPTGDRPCSTT